MATAVVTGAAGGIGRALALRLAAEGYLVHFADIAPTSEVAARTGGLASAVDVCDADAMLRLAETAGEVEVVCLNAGIVGAPRDAPLEEWHRLLGVNLLGVVNGLRAFVPLFLESGPPARIVVTGWLAGLVSFPGGGAYAATKHAVVAVTEQAALALRDTPVSVTLPCPALVRTGMSDGGEDPDDVAAAAVEAARSGRFLVAPEEWAPALKHRTDQLLAGAPPVMPAPTDLTEDRNRP